MPDLTDLAAYDYTLPPELIAQHPVEPRDAARLMVVDRRRGSLQHRTIRELPELLSPGDCLVLNTSRVVPARLVGVRTLTGGHWEGLFLGLEPGGSWKLIAQTRGRIQAGETVTIPHRDAGRKPLVLRLFARGEGGTWLATAEDPRDPLALLDEYGHVPLPPYIRQGTEVPSDRERYQTVYAATPGSAAAPTAGLHFTAELLQRSRERGISQAHVTLHVGLGTFRPVNSSDIRSHEMHKEWCELPPETAVQIQEVKQAGRRVIAVGTTSLRTMETAARESTGDGWQGESQLFIYPPYEFRSVDALLTNFHWPKSTLLMLVCAFAGYELALEAYRTAIAERYRFYSYGDAMLIL